MGYSIIQYMKSISRILNVFFNSRGPRLIITPKGTLFLFVVRWIVDIFLVPAIVPRIVQQRPWYVLFCLWNGAYKIALAAIRKE